MSFGCLHWWLPNQTNVRKNRTENFSPMHWESSPQDIPWNYWNYCIDCCCIETWPVTLPVLYFRCPRLVWPSPLPWPCCCCCFVLLFKTWSWLGSCQTLNDWCAIIIQSWFVCLHAWQSVKVELANRPTHLLKHHHNQPLPPFIPLLFTHCGNTANECYYGGAHWKSFGKFCAELSWVFHVALLDSFWQFRRSSWCCSIDKCAV